jgi:hypothetical protein
MNRIIEIEFVDEPPVAIPAVNKSAVNAKLGGRWRLCFWTGWQLFSRE